MAVPAIATRVARRLKKPASLETIASEIKIPALSLLPILFFALSLFGYIGFERPSGKESAEPLAEPAEEIPTPVWTDEQIAEVEKQIERDLERISSLDFYGILKLESGAESKKYPQRTSEPPPSTQSGTREKFPIPNCAPRRGKSLLGYGWPTTRSKTRSFGFSMHVAGKNDKPGTSELPSSTSNVISSPACENLNATTSITR